MDATSDPAGGIINLSKRTLRRSSHSHISISDTESQLDSFHSPLRSESPLRSDDPYFQNEPNNTKALVCVEKYCSPVPSPRKSNLAPARNRDFPAKDTVELGGSRLVREEQPAAEGSSGEAVTTILRRWERNVVVRRAALVFRVFEVVGCLVSFSVMAADKTPGWSGDSFDRYKEYRYCLAVNVIGFAYSCFQACNLAYQLAKGKNLISHHLHYHFDFAMDQILAYLLMSASSSAATRVNDWITNWGNDKFTLMASASIGVSFLAFIAFSASSLISGYNLCNREST